MRILQVLFCLLWSLTAYAGGPGDKQIFGLHEKVSIPELGITLPAKLDTGAQTASLSARYIKVFERDGEKMVEFDLAVNRQERERWGIRHDQWDDVQLPLSRHVRIKRRADSLDAQERDYSRRPVVTLTLCMGGHLARVDVNLTDRSDFRYPLLIGADALRALKAVVDPAQTMAMAAPACQSVKLKNQTKEAAKAQ
ncbi:MAG: RimK/LysX family protein [Alcanivorax sp.]|nr:RimK/LysX family protein [Alcanivorax sp.]